MFTIKVYFPRYYMQQPDIILLKNIVDEINIFLKSKLMDPVFIPPSYPEYISSTQRGLFDIAVEKDKATFRVKQNCHRRLKSYTTLI